ncbi:MAG: hypothetical protein O2807_08545 [bacterium]|nr:hypothetical protein [bacterium]
MFSTFMKHVAILGLLLMCLAPAAAYGAPAVEANFREKLRGGRFGGSIGAASYDYEESFSATNSSFDSSGIAWNLFADAEIVERVRIGVDWEAARISSGTERWTNLPVGTLIGAQVNQTNSLKAEIDMVDLDLSYVLFRNEKAELEIVVGWHVLRHDFNRSNFAFQVAGSTINSTLGPVDEDVFAHGPKAGIRFAGGLPPRLFVDAAFFVNTLTSVRADNSLLGQVDSDGYSLRWRVGLMYQMNDIFSVGVAYRGTYIEVNQGKSGNVILPHNETLMSSVFLRFHFRF